MNQYKKTFATIFAGQSISLLTSSIVQYAIIWYITFTTGSAVMLSIATIAAILPQTILGPFAGVIVDRWDRKKIMMLSDTFIALATLVLVVLFWIGNVPTAAIFIILAVRSIGSAFHGPSFQASIPLMAPKDKIVKIAGINQTIMSLTNIIAPMLAGILYGIWRIEFIILLDIIGAIFGVISIGVVKIPKVEKKEEKSHFMTEMKEGIKEIVHSKFILQVTIFVTLISLIFMPAGTLFPLMTSNYFGLEPFHASIVETAFSVGMLLGGVLLATWGGFKKKQYTLLISIMLFGVFLTITGILSNTAFVTFVILTALMGLMGPLFNGAYTTILQTKIAPDKLGRVFSISSSLMLIATPIGLLVCAPLAEKIGINIWFAISGLIMVVVSMLTLLSKTIRKEET